MKKKENAKRAQAMKHENGMRKGKEDGVKSGKGKNGEMGEKKGKDVLQREGRIVKKGIEKGLKAGSKSTTRDEAIPDKYRAAHMETSLPMGSKGNCSEHMSRFKISQFCNHGAPGGGGGLFGWTF